MRQLLVIAVLLILSAGAYGQSLLPAPTESRYTPIQLSGRIERHLIAESGINPRVFALGWEAYQCAQQYGYGRPGVLGIVDFSLPSYDKRLWVFDLAHQRLLFYTYVAQGLGSGLVRATRFSDEQNSFESSLGLYETANQPYVGEWGYSLRLMGLEQGYNDQAFQRAIVLHGSPYVGENIVRRYGRITVTRGCPAVPVQLVHPIVDTMQGGGLL